MPPPPRRERRESTSLAGSAKQPQLQLDANDDDEQADFTRDAATAGNVKVTLDGSQSDEDDAADDGSESAPPLVVLGSNLSSRQRLELRAMVDTVENGEIVERWHPHVTHIVMADDGDTPERSEPSPTPINVPRTVKYLCGAICGQWIVEAAWVRACQRAGRRVPERAFEVAGDLTHPDTHAPRRLREAHQRGQPPLFAGVAAFVHRRFRSAGVPEPDSIVDILRLGGAHVLEREPSAIDVRRLTAADSATRPSAHSAAAIAVQQTDDATRAAWPTPVAVLILCDPAQLGERVISGLFSRAGANLGRAPVLRFEWVLDSVSFGALRPLVDYYCVPQHLRPETQRSIAV